MNRFMLPTFLLICSLSAFGAEGPVQVATVPFYSEELAIRYDPGMLLSEQPKVEERSLTGYFRALEGAPYRVLLDELGAQRRRLDLNDWLYYQLLEKTLGVIMAAHTPLERDLTAWFLLTKEGFDTRLTYRDTEVFIYVYTENELFEVPMIEDAGRAFVNLSEIYERTREHRALYLLNFTPNPGGQAFNFYLRQMPSLAPETTEKEYTFRYRDTAYQLRLTLDRTIVELMKSYPFVAEAQYIETPLSPTLASTLLPALRRAVAGKDEWAAVELLVSFTRSSFEYREDKQHFGRSRPMIADEVFHYPYSDCEDRSALFYALVRELLDLPMIIVAFSDHLTIAVALPPGEGAPIRFQGRDYYICDPTGPVNSSEVGFFPTGYEKAEFQIIGQYK